MSNRYQDLSLDQILEITAVDAAHAPALHRQGMGLQALSDKLNMSLDSMIDSRNGIETGFQGAAGQAVFEKMNSLLRRGSKGQTRLSEQPGTFFRLSTETKVTHERMLELHNQRNQELSEAPPRERPRIWREYDQEARAYMRVTTAGYVESVRSLEPTKAYDGPRLPRSQDVNGPEGIADHTTPGPSLNGFYKDQLSGDGGPTLQGMNLSTSETVVQNNNVQPTVRPQSNMTVGLAGMAGAKGGFGRSRKGKKKRRKEGSKSTYQFESSRKVTPPVIGSRESGSSAASGGGGPTRRTDGLLPPVIGTRPTPMWAPGAGRQQMGGAAGTSASAAKPPQNKAPTKTFSSSAAGVRSVAKEHPAEGRVFRGGQSTPKRPEEPDFTRQPRIVHGEGDNLNRAVVRNSRALTPEPGGEADSRPRPTPVAPTEQSWDAQWRVTQPVVAAVIRSRRPTQATVEEQEHDPGPYLTHYNLGRST